MSDSLDDESLHLGVKTLLEATLLFTKSVADAVRELHKSALRCSSGLIQKPLPPALQVQLPNTIGSGFGSPQ